MAATRVAGQLATGRTTGSSLDISLPSLPTLGNYVVVAVGFYAPTTISSVADTQGSPLTYTLGANNVARNNRAALYYARVLAATGTYTVRITGSNAYLSGAIREIAGLATSSVITQIGNLDGLSSTPSATAAGVSSQAETYAVAVVGSDQSNLAITPGTAGTPAWAQVGEEEDGATYATYNAADRLPTSAATETEGWTLAGGLEWCAAIAVFKAATAVQDTPELRGRPFGLRGQNHMQQVLAQ